MLQEAGREFIWVLTRNRPLLKYHRLGLGLESVTQEPTPPVEITLKELANRSITAEQANWRNPKTTLKCYKDWLGRFIKDHPRLKVADFTVERFAAWKIFLKKRDYSPESINHYLSAVRAMFTFAEETGLIEKAPKIEIMENSFLDPFDNIRKEDFTDIFKDPEDKKLIDLFLDECEDCGERLTDCDCNKNNPDLNWAKERFPQLFR